MDNSASLSERDRANLREQRPAATEKQPVFLFKNDDSLNDVIRKLNHNLAQVHGDPAEAPNGTYSNESLREYDERMTAEAFAKRDREATRPGAVVQPRRGGVINPHADTKQGATAPPLVAPSGDRL